MPKLFIAIGASLVAGFAIATMTMTTDDSPSTAVATVAGFDDSADTGDRLRALERAVNEERQARQLLEDEVFRLYEELQAIDGGQELGVNELAVASAAQSETEMLGQTRVSAPDARWIAQRRRESLIVAGFSASRADWILNRESELTMEFMQERYKAMRAGETLDPMMRGNSQLKIRDELGDAQYERYLAASNSPTAVGVGNVFDASPAQRAGLLPGDEITHYAGARVFSGFDLTRQTMEGEPGENVVVNITRDGMPMQIVLPRGPLGINIGGRR